MHKSLDEKTERINTPRNIWKQINMPTKMINVAYN